ncbi:hypothetical protein EST38_g8250 [Candolleomyces aberdarensis]|uniref:F-box domain-containing protein n=1 Tax=Candolleomyces aberdarensis TaxID=2316362 RepID=A0A4Q2DD45_9AGAR|nr:hypothetical protein EST38_g8250 [Candolleomyces aberdarensis]
MSPSLKESLCFSDLPEDVGQLVFEFSAELDQETGRSCALVSRKVNAWVESILYRTLIIEYPGQLENLCGIVEDIDHADSSSTKSPDFFASHVRAIVITKECQEYAKNILSILKACHNLDILALWSTPTGRDSGDSQELLDFLASSELSPRWLSIASSIFAADKVHFSYPIFQNVTHVELSWEERNGEPDEVQWDTLRCLPCLTHCSVFPSYFQGWGQWVRETVDLCPRSLRVFILWIYPEYYLYHTSEEFEGLKAIQDGHIDSRAVLAYMGDSLPTSCDLYPILRSYKDGVRDFAGVPVGKDYWTLAEEFIEERLCQRENQISILASDSHIRVKGRIMSPSLIQNLRFSDLPDDICRMIFELITELDPENGRSCALVSRKVNTWTEPILYRTLIIKDTVRLGSLCGIIEDIDQGDSMKSPDFFASHVKGIATTNGLQQYATILSILKACHNVAKLALWITPPEGDSELRDFIVSPELSPLWISIVSNIFPIDNVHFSYPIFQNATHLDLVWEACNGVPDEVRWDTLRQLPCLTHFSVDCSFYMEECAQWVRETVGLCPRSLRVFILWIYPTYYFNDTSEEFEGLKAIQDGNVDSRVIVTHVGDSLPTLCDLHPMLRSYKDVVRDYAGIPIGEDLWTLAEEFIEERNRRRETQDGSSAA